MPSLTSVYQFMTAVGTFGSLIVFIVVAYFGFQQLQKIREQNETIRNQSELDRIFAWKNSIQDINRLIIEKPKIFIPLLYPQLYTDGMDEKEAEEKGMKITGAYASLHTLEAIYHMRKGDGQDRDQLRHFLGAYVRASDEIKEMWGIKEYRSAFTQDFQDEMNTALYGSKNP